jgi:hypothetical protein
MNQKWNLRNSLVLGVLVMGILAAGCSAAQSSETEQILETVESVIEPTESDEMQGEATGTSGAESQHEPTSIPTVEEVESGEANAPAPTAADASGGDSSPPPVVEEQTPPPLKTALEATNPSTVALGAGKPQLIEFFAFW